MSKKTSRSTSSPTVGVIGLGYVGLPLVVEMARSGGFNVIGFDVSIEKVEAINNGQSYIEDIPTAELAPLVKSGRVRATWDFSHIEQVEAISICVPTPLRKTKDPDISYILARRRDREHLRPGQRSSSSHATVPPETDEAVLPVLESTGLKVGEDFFLAFTPERSIRETRLEDANTPKIDGLTPECTRRAVKYYGRVFQNVIAVSSTKCAEMVKLLENTFRSVNIGMVNEMALMCDKLGLDVWEVIDAAASKPFGFMPFYPGPGLGGHCIPIDPHYLSWKLKTPTTGALHRDAAESNGACRATSCRRSPTRSSTWPSRSTLGIPSSAWLQARRERRARFARARHHRMLATAARSTYHDQQCRSCTKTRSR